jgi:hypothetical protein
METEGVLRPDKIFCRGEDKEGIKISKGSVNDHRGWSSKKGGMGRKEGRWRREEGEGEGEGGSHGAEGEGERRMGGGKGEREIKGPADVPHQ